MCKLNWPIYYRNRLCWVSALCTVTLDALHDRPVLANVTEQLVYMASRHFEKWALFHWRPLNRCCMHGNCVRNLEKQQMPQRFYFWDSVFWRYPHWGCASTRAAKAGACDVHEPASLANISFRGVVNVWKRAGFCRTSWICYVMWRLASLNSVRLCNKVMRRWSWTDARFKCYLSFVTREASRKTLVCRRCLVLNDGAKPYT